MTSLIRHLANYFSVCSPRPIPEFSPKKMRERERMRKKEGGGDGVGWDDTFILELHLLFLPEIPSSHKSSLP